MASEIIIIDDDSDMCDVLSAVFGQAGYTTKTFMDGRAFVRVARESTPACVLMDLYMPGLSGIEILKEIDARSYPAPILVVSAQDDVLNVVQAMRHGAFDYIEKRLGAHAIVPRVIDAVDSWADVRRKAELPAFPGLHQLTRREREILSQIAGAASNKEIARNLGISPRTVEIHRSHIMRKLGAKNSVDLMRIVMNRGRSTAAGRRGSRVTAA
jgi:two-component system, LuxR family, response regulator FixJ